METFGDDVGRIGIGIYMTQSRFVLKKEMEVDVKRNLFH